MAAVDIASIIGWDRWSVPTSRQKSYARIPDVHPIPDLIEVQLAFLSRVSERRVARAL